MEIKYDQPITVSSRQYDYFMKKFCGIVAGRFNEEKKTYEIKVWGMRYADEVKKVLENWKE